MKSKRCTLCKLVKPQTDFSPQASACKPCNAARVRSRYVKRPPFKRSERDEAGNKICTICKQAKHKEEFHGNNSRCRECWKGWCKQRYWTKYRQERQTPQGRRRWLDNYYKRLYGIGIEQYELLLASQGGGCGICGKAPEEGKRPFPVDHDHTTGHVRGILCQSCNYGLGHFDDSVEGLQRAINYLQKPFL